MFALISIFLDFSQPPTPNPQYRSDKQSGQGRKELMKIYFSLPASLLPQLPLPASTNKFLNRTVLGYQGFFDSRSIASSFIERISYLLEGKTVGFSFRAWLRKERGLGQEIQEEELVAA